MKIVQVAADGSGKEERFLEILYDEKLAEEDLWTPRELFLEAGGSNRRIKAKRQYELLLRLADIRCIEFAEDFPAGVSQKEYIKSEHRTEGTAWDGICTDCYLLSRYKDRLLALGAFQAAAESILCAADGIGMQKEAAAQMEAFLKREESYERIEDGIRPVLIYKGEEICHNVLNVFAEQFGAAFRRAGILVEYFDAAAEENRALTRFIGTRYRAVIGMQTYLYSIRMKEDGQFLHDLIRAPKFNFVFDHPIWMKHHILESPKDMCFFTLDSNYAAFIRNVYQKKAYLLPPAGILPETGRNEKRYAVSFVGSYGDFWQEARLIHGMERSIRFIANRFLLLMRKRPGLPAEEAFLCVLEHYGICCGREEFLELFYRVRRVMYCVMHYYRYRVIKMLLDAGMRVDVFGGSWESCPLGKYPNLICHPDVTTQESMQVWQQSDLSLNVMSWHKSGFTERMANIMLSGAVLACDETAYLNGRFEHGKDLLVFRLDALDELPNMLREYLKNPETLREISGNGFVKAKKRHTWDSRVKEFLEILEERPCGA